MAQAATFVSSILELCGHHEEAAEALEEVLRAVRRLGRTEMRPAAVLALVNVYTKMGQFEPAIDRRGGGAAGVERRPTSAGTSQPPMDAVRAPGNRL